MHYYQHHIGDFIRDTARLTDSQSMAYLRLIWSYYETEAPIENDIDAIAFQIGANASDVNQILKHYFVLNADTNKWHHTRCDKVIAEFYSKSDKARNSAKARWNNSKNMPETCERNANASETDANERVFDATHIPNNPITHTPKPPSGVGSVLPSQKSDEVLASFDRFWSTYPRHEGKKKALEWFQKRNPSPELVSQMLASIDVQAKSDGWQKDGGRFIPMPATWLNGDRWEDVVPSAPTHSLKVGTTEYFAFHKSKTWWREAGFGSVWEAANAKCWHHNAHEFQNGKRGVAA